MNITEKRRSFLINVMYFTVLIGLFFLFFKYAFGICLPLLTALFVAAVLQKPVDYLTKKAKGGRGIFSALLVIFCFVVLGSIFAIALMKLFSEMKSFFSYLMLKLENTSNIAAAKALGTAIAKKAQDAGIKAVVFDRAGYIYKGRVAALAEAAREAGLDF